ncbi:bifunctional diaminohydroxyphosphoribosylaminopyrimidine deaminase/5-amino-6-(5-phosphoribosylamino)uracil reductase RibD [Roseobacter sinensis]|uniref:Riboflavin biosynthesis protein RibD n=1 Tax=Roseobacter sinensis TaxID=2931391 RepID=A0ABT3BGA0_9RHOB|nr:bifunctional diaminohydroxyphosphoribosylaminopyrimidine deaminase/5-amino-6-(5-phosphoribosylamino)uracil reductase RibD [Roseobacter sp. WL0113]MCV3272617.1 bifunctional diaminohydroxyphosphoribosylaminopyrimidine deaminase/5-amino-6-(5-phosphoribosylamino)uracil reductase RibD [Roseobacter sp. WL0113]
MALALSLGRRGLGRTAPNPAVGCVIVKEGRIVGRGWTQPGGRPHAETAALTQAGPAARGADVYVTLEPCAHQGETPPCAQALIDAGVARVVAATQDPDPRVSGQGLEMLRAAGIAVDVGLLEDDALQDNAGFFARVELDRPFVTLKLASSFDGRIATATGESQWITGLWARRYVHGLRARHDAVMVGGGTARKDDPSLTVRGLGTSWQPARVVISRRLDLPLMGTFARTAREVPVILCHGHDADATLMQTWEDLGATLLPCAAARGQLDPADILRQLAGHGLTRVFCEGGSALAASLIEADLVDELVGFTAGVAIGAEGLPCIGALGLEHLDDAARFALVRSTPLGGDVLHVWRRAP